MGKAGSAFETPLLQNVSAGIGFLGFMIGLFFSPCCAFYKGG
jgi:hypothetical protein